MLGGNFRGGLSVQAGGLAAVFFAADVFEGDADVASFAVVLELENGEGGVFFCPLFEGEKHCVALVALLNGRKVLSGFLDIEGGSSPDINGYALLVAHAHVHRAHSACGDFDLQGEGFQVDLNEIAFCGGSACGGGRSRAAGGLCRAVAAALTSDDEKERCSNKFCLVEHGDLSALRANCPRYAGFYDIRFGSANNFPSAISKHGFRGTAPFLWKIWV